MSVPESKRTQSKFELLVDANELCIYTLRITSNPKIFLPEMSNCLVSDVQYIVKRIYLNLWTANDTYVRPGDFDALRSRLEHQEKAISECTEMLAYIGLCQRAFHLKAKRVNYWTRQVYDLREKIKNWRTSDRKRFQ